MFGYAEMGGFPSSKKQLILGIASLHAAEHKALPEVKQRYMDADFQEGSIQPSQTRA